MDIREQIKELQSGLISEIKEVCSIDSSYDEATADEASMKPFDVYSYLKPYGKEVFPGQHMNANLLASTLKYMTHTEVRSTVIGYTQRGCQPSARDCAFAFEAGNMAVVLLKSGIGNQVIGKRNNRTFHTSINTALCETRNFKESPYNLINSL